MMRVRPRTIAAMALSGAGAAFVVFACYTPTAMTIAITTDVECRAGGALAPRTALYVGPTMVGLEPSADTFDCSAGTPNSIGSIVFAPDDHASEPRITVHVAMNTTGAGTAACRQPGASLPTTCIVARRSFKFREHDSRRLSVHLDKRCAGKFCDETRTCTVLAGGVPDCTPADVDDPGFIGDSADAAADATADADGTIVQSDAPGDAIDPGAPCNAGGGVLAQNLVAASHVAVNATSVFYTQLATDGHVDVLSVPKTGGGVPKLEWSTQVGNTVTALAVDDAVLWIGTEDLIVRQLFAGGGSSETVGTVRSIALHENVAYFLAQGGTHLRRMRSTGTAEPIPDTSGAITGDAVAAAGDGAGKPGRLFVLDNVGNRVKNYPLPWAGTPAPTVASFADFAGGTSIAAARSGTRFEAFVTFPPNNIGWTMQTLSTVSAVADDTTQPTGIVADGTGTFHIASVQASAAIRKTLLGPPSVPTLTPSVPLEPTYFDIKGLAIDANCVYFSASVASGGPYTLRARRKTPAP